MIIDTPKTTISQNIQVTSTPFTIELNAITFEILSRDLYKNPIKAIIRELCCNAIDSHNRANNPQPFDIHLPTKAEPYLTIQDYGTGLSREAMETLYSSYFTSDKRGTNDEIGGKGLGSKTPLAYTDTFSVISYHNGQQHTYAIHKNEHGLPTLTHILSNPIQEPNGLCITIGIKQDDIEKFNTEAKQILPWMPYRLTNLLHTFEIPTPTTLFEQENFRLVKKNTNLISSTSSHVLMGNVLYPIDLSQVTFEYAFRSFFANINLIITANIGDLDVTAGRDELLYSKKTTDNLTQQLLLAEDWIQSVIQTHIQNRPTLFSAHRELHRLANNLCGYPGNLNYIKPKYFDEKTHHTLSTSTTPKTPIKGTIYKIAPTRRNAKTIPLTTTLESDRDTQLCHSTNPVTKKAILEADLANGAYLLVSTNQKEIDDFYALLPEQPVNDVTWMFPPKEKTPRKKATGPKITHRILDPYNGEIEKDGPPPDDALILKKENNKYILEKNAYRNTNNWKDLILYLTEILPTSFTIVVVSKSTPKRSYPKLGFQLTEVLRNILIEKYKNITRETALTQLAIARLRKFIPHSLPCNPTIEQDLYFLYRWKLIDFDITLISLYEIENKLTQLANTIQVL